MEINNIPLSTDVVKFMGLIRYLQNLKFQAKYILSKDQRLAKKEEFETLLAKADELASKLKDLHRTKYKNKIMAFDLAKPMPAKQQESIPPIAPNSH